MCPKIFNQKSYTEVQIRLSLHTFMQILSPSAIKLWPGHRLRRKNNNINNNNNKGSKISTGPLYYSIVGTVTKKIYKSEFFHGCYSNLFVYQTILSKIKMATIYPSLEDMVVDKMAKVCDIFLSICLHNSVCLHFLLLFTDTGTVRRSNHPTTSFGK